MSDAVLVTGKRGSGKSLFALHMIRRYLREGRTVATNLNLNLDAMLPPYSRAVAYRIPDVPDVAHLEALPLGNPVPTNEKKNGLLVLDEVGAWMNSRDWNKGGRQEVIAWLLQSRKFGWDLLLIAQHARLVDAQVRDSLCELWGVCRRLDKMRVPLIGGVWQTVFGKPLKMPKLHIVTLFYGFSGQAPVAERQIFSGGSLFAAYDTTQKINAMTGNKDTFSYLSPWHLKGRYIGRFEMLRGAWIAGVVVGLIMGLAGGWFGRPVLDLAPELAVVEVDPSVKVTGYSATGEGFTVVLSDGRISKADAVRTDKDGYRFRVGASWFGQ